MTHAELVRRVGRWLRTTQRHAIVLEEIGTDGEECPDVIGWMAHASTTLVECKISVSDFKADAKKVFRAHPERGMGDHRWYACPDGLLMPADMPAGWGLLWVGPRSCKVKCRPTYRHQASEVVKRKEARLLVSALKRATEGWGRKVFGEISPVDGQLDPHPSMAATLKQYRESAQSALRQRDALNDVIHKRDRELSALRGERHDLGVKLHEATSRELSLQAANNVLREKLRRAGIE